MLSVRQIYNGFVKRIDLYTGIHGDTKEIIGLCFLSPLSFNTLGEPMEARKSFYYDNVSCKAQWSEVSLFLQSNPQFCTLALQLIFCITDIGQII